MYLEVLPSRVCSQTVHVLEVTALLVQEIRSIRVSFDTLNHDRYRVPICVYGLGNQLQWLEFGSCLPVSTCSLCY